MKKFYCNKNIIITGAASGIGYQLTKQLLDLDATVFAIDLNPCNLEHPKLIKFTANVASLDDMSRLSNEILSKSPIIDIVIANAGIGGLNPAENFSLEIHKRTIEVNSIGIANTLMPYVPQMLSRQNGYLVAISSLAAFRGLPKAASYSSSKSQQMVFMESLRVDLAPKGIHVTSVHPGFVKTAMTNHDDFQMPFMVTAEEASMGILKAIIKNKKVFLFPWPMRVLTFFNRNLPNFIYDLIIPRVGGHKKDVKAKIL